MSLVYLKTVGFEHHEHSSRCREDALRPLRHSNYLPSPGLALVANFIALLIADVGLDVQDVLKINMHSAEIVAVHRGRCLFACLMGLLTCDGSIIRRLIETSLPYVVKM